MGIGAARSGLVTGDMDDQAPVVEGIDIAEREARPEFPDNVPVPVVDDVLVHPVRDGDPAIVEDAVEERPLDLPAPARTARKSRSAALGDRSGR